MRHLAHATGGIRRHRPSPSRARFAGGHIRTLVARPPSGPCDMNSARPTRWHAMRWRPGIAMAAGAEFRHAASWAAANGLGQRTCPIDRCKRSLSSPTSSFLRLRRPGDIRHRPGEGKRPAEVRGNGREQAPSSEPDGVARVATQARRTGLRPPPWEMPTFPRLDTPPHNDHMSTGSPGQSAIAQPQRRKNCARPHVVPPRVPVGLVWSTIPRKRYGPAGPCWLSRPCAHMAG